MDPTTRSPEDPMPADSAPRAPAAALLALLALVGCGPVLPPGQPPAPTPAPVVEPPSPANARERHLEVHWVRSAAEYRALTVQVYRSASDQLRDLAQPLEPGSWAVILDADETVLDNSEFQRRIAETGQTFDEALWAGWVLEEDAELVPGAGAFIDLVQQLGGRVAIVTNRAERLCPATRRNLAALGVQPMVVLCQAETGEKEPRFRMVQEGSTGAGVGPLQVVMWLGDNVGDFPDLDQTLRDGPDEVLRLFGRRYFVLPNPMYGSWLGNAWR